jgi:hypothetical protein
MGVPSQPLVPWIFDERVVREICLYVHFVDLPPIDQWRDNPCSIPCVRVGLYGIEQQYAAVQIRNRTMDSAFSDEQGYFPLPIAYKLVNMTWLQDTSARGGVSDIMQGFVRVLAGNEDLTVCSALSDPVTFSYTGDVDATAASSSSTVSSAASSVSSPCVSLTIGPDYTDIPSRFLYGDAYGPRRGYSFGGLDFGSGVLVHPDAVGVGLIDFDSWIIKPTTPIPEGVIPPYLLGVVGTTSPLALRCVYEPNCARFITRNGCNVTSGDAKACLELSYMQALNESAIDRWPSIRIRALDEQGNGVAGLRVRLRQLSANVLPDLPAVTSVISCGLATADEYMQDAAWAEEANSLPEMDGTPRTERALACVTDVRGAA